MKRSALILVAAMAVIAGTATWKWFHRRPNVLLITIDTMRQDRLGCYGYAGANTPNLDRLAAEGAVFENAFCDVTWTGPSLASTMTGTYATRHGIRSSYQQLGDENVTIAESLRDAGYRTAAIVGSFPASSIFGFGQGFETYNQDFSAPILKGGEFADDKVPLAFHDDIDAQNDFQLKTAETDGYRPDEDVTTAALSWLGQKPTEPFFLWVHYFGPHEKMDLRADIFDEIHRSMKVYDRDVAEADHAVGRLLDALRERKLLDQTMVVIHADHGQSLSEHDSFGHGRYLYDEVLRVPLLVRYPPLVPAGKRLQTQARNIDILPTILDAASVVPSPRHQGRSLLPIIASPSSSPPTEGETYCETYLSATRLFADTITQNGDEIHLGFRRRGIRTPRYLFVQNTPWPFIDTGEAEPIPAPLVAAYSSEELYDLQADPDESKNLADQPSPTLEDFRSRLQAYVKEAAQADRRDLDEASKERLRNLGYLKD